MEAKFTKSAYTEFVTSRDAEFLKRTDFGGKFSEQFTESAYMDFVKWAKKIPSEPSKEKIFPKPVTKSSNLRISCRKKN